MESIQEHQRQAESNRNAVVVYFRAQDKRPHGKDGENASADATRRTRKSFEGTTTPIENCKVYYPYKEGSIYEEKRGIFGVWRVREACSCEEARFQRKRRNGVSCVGSVMDTSARSGSAIPLRRRRRLSGHRLGPRLASSSEIQAWC